MAALEGVTKKATGMGAAVPARRQCRASCYASTKPPKNGKCRCKGCLGKGHGKGEAFVRAEGYLVTEVKPRRLKLKDAQAKIFSEEELERLQREAEVEGTEPAQTRRP